MSQGIACLLCNAARSGAKGKALLHLSLSSDSLALGIRRLGRIWAVAPEARMLSYVAGLTRLRCWRRAVSPLRDYVDRRVEYVLLHNHLVYGDRTRLTIDRTAIVNNALFNLSSGCIDIGPYAFFSHSVSLITGVHDYTKVDLARQRSAASEGRDIIVNRGAWLACNVTVLGPCTIGEHAVVAAGSVVTEDVPPRSLVAGIPARVVREIVLTAEE